MMNSRMVINSIIDSIKQLSTTQTDFKSLKDNLSCNMDVILSAGKNIESPGRSLLQNAVAELVTVPSCSLGVAILMAAQAENLPDSCAKIYMQQCKQFFANGSSDRENTFLAHKEVIIICQKLANLSNRAKQPRAVTRTLMQATLLSAPGTTFLTPLHAIFLQNCISGKMYSLATDFLLQNEILEVSPKEFSLSAEDYLEFFYYAGLCFIAIKNYALALDFFLQAVSFPAQALSAIAVASFKAGRLVSLIDSGSAFEVPKYVSHIMSRFVKQDMPVYDAIVKNFLANDLTLLSECVESGTGVLTEDHNLGLARQVVISLRRQNIKKLTSTYITLSLQDISTIIRLKNVKETESLLFEMIASNEINACINQHTSMIKFNHTDNENQSPSSSAERIRENEVALVKLEGHIRNTIEISDKLRDMQQRIITSEEYLSRSLKLFQSGGIIGQGGLTQGESSGWAENDSLSDFIKYPNA